MIVNGNLRVNMRGLSERTRAQSANWPYAKSESMNYKRCCA